MDSLVVEEGASFVSHAAATELDWESMFATARSNRLHCEDTLDSAADLPWWGLGCPNINNNVHKKPYFFNNRNIDTCVHTNPFNKRTVWSIDL